MSYDISLRDPVTHETLEVGEPHFMAGGTYAVGGTNELWLSVTYNYAGLFKKAFGEGGIKNLDGMGGAESIAWLEEGASKLGDDVSRDYWEPTEGNAKRPLLQLAAMAKMRPDGVWNVS